MAVPKLTIGLTFDDVLLEPRRSAVVRSEVVLHTQLTKQLTLNIPIISAAMDTVSDAPMAIALGKLGGLAVVHRNCTIAEEVAMVRQARAKKVQVGAAVGPHDMERAKALDQAGASAIFLDCAHAHSVRIIQSAKRMKKSIKAPLVVGNIATKEAAAALVTFADAVKVGIGPGAICTTRVVAGIGVPQLTAIQNVVAVAKKKNIPVIADGGIKYSGDIVKALAAGASSVMLGSLLAGTKEAPGRTLRIKGQLVKSFRGMGSLGAMAKGQSSDRYFQKDNTKYVPEGIEGIVPYKGPVKDVIWQLIGGLKSGMGYIGSKTITDISKQARFIQITNVSLIESHPHGVTITKPAPNY
ncbi:IMP dehydrogenase [Patescibacteria group bacterium]|nr:IMP dehydrogenase [Patescibacteria group bacterium]